MFPRIELFTLGETDLFLPTYGLMFAAGVIVAWFWFMRRTQGMNLVQEKVFNLTFYAIIAGILGAKLTLIVVSFDDYVENPRLLLGTIRSAGVLMGGVLAAAIVFYLYARRNGLPVHALGDAAAAPIALAQSIGRVGCFLAGCCYGIPADPDNPLRVVFSPLSEAGGGVARVPVQGVQMINDLVLALILTVLWRRKIRPAGSVFWIYVLLYSLSRGIIEFWRGDTIRGVYIDGAVSTSQLFSLAGIVLASIMLVKGWIRKPQTAP
ncbi:MAG: prolipoprotein diacylglyceryl transferase [Acidobacteriota bacterium]|nr:prolipoprotein diacylglyceryl transferase [Acidobacteriota bacterium]